MKEQMRTRARTAILAVLLVFTALTASTISLTAKSELLPYADTMTAAVGRMQRCMNAVKRYKLDRGIMIDDTVDLYKTGMLGEGYTAITTTLGAVEAKRTSANPEMAALAVRLLYEAGVRAGDTVGCCFSGSFPSLNIAVLCACDAMGVTPVYTAAVGASTYGANQVELTSPEMLQLLYLDGLIARSPVGVTMGGGKDVGEGMAAVFPDEELPQIAEIRGRILDLGLSITELPIHAENVAWRMSLYGDIDCFVNVGGNVIGTGGSRTSGMGQGVLKQRSVRLDENSGLIEQYMARGIPVVHLLNLKELLSEYGMIFDSPLLASQGRGAEYYTTTYPVWAIVLSLAGVAVLLIFYRWPDLLQRMMKGVQISIASKRVLVLGVALVALGILMPAVLTVYNFGIYHDLSYAVRDFEGIYVLIAAFKLLLLNIVRGFPHYLGVFYIADSIRYTRGGKRRPVFQMAIIAPLVLLVYQLIDVIYKIRYDFGVPAILMILLLLLLSKIDFSVVSAVKKALMVFFMLCAVQTLDIMPNLSNLPFGHGNTTYDIKQASQFLEMDSFLNGTAAVFLILMTVCAFLFVVLIRDENHIVTVSRQKEQRERELMGARIAVLESRTYLELDQLLHDLKTPLTSTQALVGVVKLRTSDSITIGYLDKIELSVERLSLMISEFLDENKCSRMSVDALFTDLRSQVSILPYAGCVSIECLNDDLYVQVNRVRFQRMLINMIENSYHALRSREDGYIRVTASRGAEADGVAYFTVQDNGTGMTDEVKANIWNKGFSTSGSYGIGLSFVKRVVDCHGGEITIDSTPDHGTTFTIAISEDA